MTHDVYIYVGIQKTLALFARRLTLAEVISTQAVASGGCARWSPPTRSILAKPSKPSRPSPRSQNRGDTSSYLWRPSGRSSKTVLHATGRPDAHINLIRSDRAVPQRGATLQMTPCGRSGTGYVTAGRTGSIHQRLSDADLDRVIHILAAQGDIYFCNNSCRHRAISSFCRRDQQTQENDSVYPTLYLLLRFALLTLRHCIINLALLFIY